MNVKIQFPMYSQVQVLHQRVFARKFKVYRIKFSQILTQTALYEVINPVALQLYRTLADRAAAAGQRS